MNVLPKLDDDLLRDALAWRADGPDARYETLDDVMTVVRGTSQRRSWGLPLAGASRLIIIAVAFAAVLVSMLGATLVGGSTPLGRDLTDILRGRAYVAPFQGIPPEGATVTASDTGALVLDEVSIHPFRAVKLYADGRLIWDAEEASMLDIGGWVEQRVTAEAVELLRRGVVPLSVWPALPASSLPADAWVDRTLRAYVPSRYAACYEFRVPGLQESPVGLASAGALESLPTAARALLEGATIRSDGASRDGTPEESTCREVTTDTARALDRILVGAGADTDGDPYYTFPAAGSTPNLVLVSLFPLLPDGGEAMGFG